MQATSLSLALALACTTFSTLSTAAQAGPPSTQVAGATELDEVIVTATRTEIALDDSLVPAQVIDREDIERSQARTVAELLRGRAGIDVGNQGGVGKLATVFIRGSESDHVLVMVDGVRIGSATAGLAAFQDLPLEQIERIEVVRGPRSSLYGSEAIGGVIQVFTRRDRGPVRGRFRAGAGSHGLREASAGLGGGAGTSGWFGADVAYQSTDGIDACRGSAALFRGCFADEPDRDGYRNRSVTVRGGTALREGLDIEATALRADSENEFDGSPFGGNEAANVQQALGLKLAYAPSPATRLTVRAGRSDDRSENHFSDAAAGTRRFVSTFDTRRHTASVQADFTAAPGHLVTLGADWQRDAIETTSAFAEDRRDNIAAFAEYQATLGEHQLQASARNDDNGQFGDHATGSIGWGWRFSPATRLALSYGTGFKAPSFNDLYFPFFGNPDLRPERSRTFNAGLRGQAGEWQWTLDAYETHVDDLVTYDASIFLPNNLERARIRGIEWTLAGTFAGWDVSTELSHADPRNRTPGAGSGLRLARRARDSGRVDIDRKFGAWRIGATLNGAGHRYDDAANTVRLGGYSTLDLRASWVLSPDWTLQVLGSNVFDRSYETVAWYNQPGRTYGLSLRYAPGP